VQSKPKLIHTAKQENGAKHACHPKTRWFLSPRDRRARPPVTLLKRDTAKMAYAEQEGEERPDEIEHSS
jgi:hypothetical protein